jgi:hypothetical protein
VPRQSLRAEHGGGVARSAACASRGARHDAGDGGERIAPPSRSQQLRRLNDSERRPPPFRAQRPLRPRARNLGEAGSAQPRRGEHWTVGATPIKCTGNRTEGSNPSLSLIFPNRMFRSPARLRPKRSIASMAPVTCRVRLLAQMAPTPARSQAATSSGVRRSGRGWLESLARTD